MLIKIQSSWRDLRKIIMMLLKSKIATKIIKMNYVQSFCLQEDKIIKEEIKVLSIETENPELCLKKIQQQNSSAEILS